MKTSRLLLLALVALLHAPSVRSQAADPPNLLGVQLRLADSLGTPLVGPVALELRLYDPEVAGNLLWSEAQSPTALAGVVAAQLGATNPLPANLFDGGERFLALQVGGDPEMTPRMRVVSAPFARRAASVARLDAGTILPAGLIESSHVLDGSIAAGDVAADSLTGGQIADGSIHGAELASGAVGSTHISVGAVTGSALASGAVTDVDVSATAAIQGTKIHPDFGALDVLTDGRLGIGTSNPEESVHVKVGGLRVDGGAISARNPDQVGAAVTLGWKNDVARIRLGGTGTGSATGLDIQTIGDDSLMRLLDNGNVGIGTTDPQLRLHVDGGSDTSPTSGGNVQIGPSTGAHVSIDNNEIMARSATGTSTLYLNNDGGNVKLSAGSGDATVQLPPDAVSPAEQSAEPGIAFQRDSLSLEILETVGVLTARTIDCPAPGFVVAIATGRAQGPAFTFLSGWNYFSISKGVYNQHNPNNIAYYEWTEQKWEHVSISGCFQVGAGSHNFYFLASKTANAPTEHVSRCRLTLMYFPTAYGTVEAD